jgi:hypothetical protein
MKYNRRLIGAVIFSFMSVSAGIKLVDLVSPKKGTPKYEASYAYQR